ncbi:unnamed protein product [Pleuronectes platessa]|uniref:Uncharacterized protein n=1 Tax=Pleuronectes platessa TaxID=8262 RepID=A0A9N7UYZ5_PLEPL|nr:unnamed protein product [Pleuronectes platessa]
MPPAFSRFLSFSGDVWICMDWVEHDGHECPSHNVSLHDKSEVHINHSGVNVVTMCAVEPLAAGNRLRAGSDALHVSPIIRAVFRIFLFVMPNPQTRIISASFGSCPSHNIVIYPLLVLWSPLVLFILRSLRSLDLPPPAPTPEFLPRPGLTIALLIGHHRRRNSPKRAPDPAPHPRHVSRSPLRPLLRLLLGSTRESAWSLRSTSAGLSPDLYRYR